MEMPREHYITGASQKHASIRYKDNIKWEIKGTHCWWQRRGQMAAEPIIYACRKDKAENAENLK